MKQRKILTILLGTSLAISTTCYAATTGSVDLAANSAVVNSIVVASAGSPVTSLGNSTQDDILFGTITIDSNDGAGFDINLTSAGADPGNLVLLDSGGTPLSSPGSDQKIAYTATLTSAGSGSLGTGISVPSDVSTPTDLSLSGVATVLEFDGPASTGTSAYVLNMKFSSLLKSTLLGGNYKDTIQVEIVER